jgi:hypothetical protein
MRRSSGGSTIIPGRDLCGIFTRSSRFTLSASQPVQYSSVTTLANSRRAISLTIVGGGLPHNWVSHIRAGEIVNSRDLVVQFDLGKLKKASTRLRQAA